MANQVGIYANDLKRAPLIDRLLGLVAQPGGVDDFVQQEVGQFASQIAALVADQVVAAAVGIGGPIYPSAAAGLAAAAEGAYFNAVDAGAVVTYRKVLGNAVEVMRAPTAAALTAEVNRATGVEAGLKARVDIGSVYPLGQTTGTSIAYVGANPNLPALVDGITCTFVPHVLSGTAPKLNGAAVVTAAGDVVGDAELQPGALHIVQYLNGQWRLLGGDVSTPKTYWFDSNPTIGLEPVAILPTTEALEDSVIVNNDANAQMMVGFGFEPSLAGKRGIPIPPKQGISSDKKVGTPIYLVSDTPGVKATLGFSTRNGRNPLADDWLDGLLARNGTILPAPWIPPIRTLLTDIFPFVQTATLLTLFAVPDLALAKENWAFPSTPLTPINNPTHDPKKGFNFTGNTDGKYIDTHVTSATDPHATSVLVATVDTAPVSSELQWAISNQVNGVAPMRTAGIAVKSSSPSSDVVLPAQRGGLCGFSRKEAATYRAYGRAQAFALSRVGNTKVAFNFLIGADAAVGTGAPTSTGFYRGNLHFTRVGDPLSDNEVRRIRVALETYITSIGGL